MHYSFDFTQQIFFPSYPLQPGPIYFKTPKKCAVFGVCCEPLSCQINYLLDEACDVGKGANCVVSLLHHFFENYGLGEEQVHLHADNCSGQNKNSCMMMYLMWRVLTGRHKRITLSFMLTGHTKFSCDWCFGLFKWLFRKEEVATPQPPVPQKKSRRGGRGKSRIWNPFLIFFMVFSYHALYEYNLF